MQNIYCHDCESEKVSEIDGIIKCPDCGSEFVEILEEEDQPAQQGQQQPQSNTSQGNSQGVSFAFNFNGDQNDFLANINQLLSNNRNTQTINLNIRSLLESLFNTNMGDYEQGNFEDILNQLFQQYNKKGNPPASKDEVESLPIKTLTKEDLSTYDECAICLSQYEEGEQVKEVPCHHAFHVDCIDKWLNMSNFCPVCKYELKTDDEDYEKQKEQSNTND